MKKQKNDNEKQIGVYLFQVVSIFVLFFCVWLLTREKTYNEIDVNKVAQNLVELMPDTVVSENDMVVKNVLGWRQMPLMRLSTMDQIPIWMRRSCCLLT